MASLFYFACFIVSDQPPVVSKPGKGAFNSPAFWLDGETPGICRAAYDLQAQPAPREQLTESAHHTHASVSGVKPRGDATDRSDRATSGRSCAAPAGSETLAEVTSMPRIIPSVSTTRCRLRPNIFFPTS
jgi:hypothetical protein